MNNDYLEHHGIKGQRWGIRRYQNEDGSYTKAGLARYYTAKKRYDDSRENLNKAKESGDKYAIKNAKAEYRAAKRDESKSYRALEADKRADKGKELYKKGETIGKIQTQQILMDMGTTGLAAASAWAYTQEFTQGKRIIPLSVFVASLVGDAAYSINAETKKNQLRAYYAHK